MPLRADAQLCPTLSSPIYWSPPGPSVWNFPGKNTRVSCHFLLQGIVPTQGSNLRLLRWQADSLLLELPGKSMPWLPCWNFQLLFLEEWEGKHCCWKHLGFFFFFRSLFSCNVVILYGNKLWLTHSRDISLKTFRVLICSKEAFTVFEAQIQWENKFSGASCVLVQRACLWSPVLIFWDVFWH